MIQVVTVNAERSFASVAIVVSVCVIAEIDLAAVAVAVIVLVGAKVFATSVAIVACIVSVSADGKHLFADITEVISISVVTHGYKAEVADAVFVFVYAKISVTNVTVVSFVASILAKTVSAPIAVMILVSVVNASAENDFANVAKVVFVRVLTAAYYERANVAFVIEICVCVASAEGGLAGVAKMILVCVIAQRNNLSAAVAKMVGIAVRTVAGSHKNAGCKQG